METILTSQAEIVVEVLAWALAVLLPMASIESVKWSEGLEDRGWGFVVCMSGRLFASCMLVVTLVYSCACVAAIYKYISG